MVTILLLAVTAGLLFALRELSAAISASQDDQARREYLIGMTYLTLVLLVLAVAVLAFIGVRWIARTMKPRRRPEPTSDISAWEEAGKRFTLPDEDQGDEPDGPDE